MGHWKYHTTDGINKPINGDFSPITGFQIKIVQKAEVIEQL